MNTVQIMEKREIYPTTCASTDLCQTLIEQGFELPVLEIERVARANDSNAQ